MEIKKKSKANIDLHSIKIDYKRVNKIFRTRPEIYKVYCSEDGKIFSSLESAKKHNIKFKKVLRNG